MVQNGFIHCVSVDKQFDFYCTACTCITVKIKLETFLISAHFNCILYYNFCISIVFYVSLCRIFNILRLIV